MKRLIRIQWTTMIPSHLPLHPLFFELCGISTYIRNEPDGAAEPFSCNVPLINLGGLASARMR